MRKLFILFLCGLMLLTNGCSLAQTPTSDSPMQTADRLVGVLVTTEHLDLFDMEGWLNDHIGDLVDGEAVVDGDTSKYQGRIYAACTEDGTYEFPEALGGSLFMAPTVTDPETGDTYTCGVVTTGFSEASTHLISTDAGSSIRLTGTVYFDPYTISRETVYTDETMTEQEQILAFYCNPVYQTAAGDVYLVSGSGHSFSTDTAYGMESFNSNMSLTDTLTTTVNGETSELINEVTVNFQGVKPAEEIILIEMSEDHRQLRAVSCTPEQMPREIVVGSDVAYVIAETHSTVDGEVSVNRQICTAGAEDESIKVFVPLGNGLAAPQKSKVISE